MSLSIQSKHNRNMQMLVNEATNAIESELGAKTYNSNTADLSVDRVNKEGYYILKVTAKAKEGDQEIELQRYVKIRGENSN